eukprot:COSAG03_NODE_5830_length_1166_cov_2.601687_1_plen_194_part_01
MLRRASAHPRQSAQLQTERAALLRHLLSAPGVLAEGVPPLPSVLEALDAVKLVTRLSEGAGPLGAAELEELCVRSRGVESVAAVVRAGELPGHELDLSAYELSVLHCVSVEAPETETQRERDRELSAHRQYVLQSLRRAAGISRREVSHIEVLVRSAQVSPSVSLSLCWRRKCSPRRRPGAQKCSADRYKDTCQ